MIPSKKYSRRLKLSLAVAVLFLASVTWSSYWWIHAWSPAAQITKYRITDAVAGDVNTQNLILGSSTAKGIPSNFEACGAWLNRGIGNGSTADFLRYIAGAPYRSWENLLVYTGDNDIAFGASAERALEATRVLLDSVQRKFNPDRIFLIPIKLSPARARFESEYLEFNRRLEELTDEYETLELLPHSLAFSQGSKELYESDRLHLSSVGYNHLLHSLRQYCE